MMVDTNKKFSDDNAMSYEYLIRRAHQCGRFGVAGANADTFRRLIRNASIYYSEMNAIKEKTERLWGKSEQDLLATYMQCCGEISAYINTAVEKVKKEYDEKLEDEQHIELDEVQGLLHDTNYDKIIEALCKAEKIFLDLKLFPK